MAAVIFLILVVAMNPGVFRFIVNSPGAITWSTPVEIFHCGLVPLAAALLLAAIFFLLGRAIQRLLEVGEEGGFGHALSFALGWGTTATAIFLVGVAGFLNRLSLGLILLAAAAAGIFGLKGLRSPRFKSWDEDPKVWWKTVLIGVFAFAAFHAAVNALAPETAWDALAYHLAIPKIYLAWGRVQEISWLVHSHWPHLADLFYALPLAFGLEGTGALTHAAATAVLAASVFFVAREELGETQAWLAAAAAAFAPVALQFAGSSHSDGFAAMLHFLAAVLVWRWDARGGRGRLIAAGLLAGFCAATKLYTALTPLTLAAWILWRRRREGLKPAAIFLLCAFALAAPWYLKSWVGAGNPVWPWFYGLFGGKFGPEAVVRASGHGWSLGRMPRDFVFLGAPFTLIPLMVFALRRAWKREKPPAFVVFLLLPAIPYTLFLFKSTALWRYLWPVYPAFAMMIAWSCLEDLSKRSLFRYFAMAVIAWGFMGPITISQNNQLFPVLGVRSARRPQERSREVYLGWGLDYYDFYRRVNARADIKRLLLFREIRGYHLDVPYLWGDPLNQGLIRYDRMKDGEALARRLGALGVSHVLINEGNKTYAVSADYYTPKILEMMADLLSAYGTRADQKGPIVLYALSLPPAA